MTARTVLFRILGPVLAVAALMVGVPTQASAHPLSTTAVLLDIESDHVDAHVQLPLDQLSDALDEKLTATKALQPATLARLRSYVSDHLSATDADKRSWMTDVSGGTVEQIDGVDHLVLDATLTPSAGTVGDFDLHYDAIIESLQSHRVFVSARDGDTGSYATLVMLSWQRTSVPVASVHQSQATGFTSAVGLGIDHIRGGSDHLLFLIMLLLPAPLLARGRRWVRRDDLGRASWRVVHVVSAFAVGHSITLVLGALRLVHLPTRLIEAGIALSVLVSAIHAIRPLVRRGEVAIALSFGLLHGLAFAALLDEIDLSRSSFVLTLLGFNVGIELTQLLVVALVMPSLLVLSRTRAYPALRVGLAGLGAAVSTGWLLERVGVLSTNVLEPIANVLVDQPLVAAAFLGVVAGVSWLVPGGNVGGDPERKSDEHCEVLARAT